MFTGEDAIKKNARQYQYVYKPTKMPDTVFYDYVSRASLPGVFESTIYGRLGDIFRKAPIIQGPDELVDWCEDVTINGQDMTMMASKVLRELMITGRCAMVLDFDNQEQRHTISFYQAEDILHWSDVRGQEMVRLREAEYSADEFSEASERLIDIYMEDGRCVAQRHQKIDGKWLTEETSPTRAGGSLDFFPVVVVNSDEVGMAVNEPPMLNLANLLLGFFRNSADYEQGLHAIGVPTPVVTGLRPEEAQFSLGPYTPILIESPDAKAYYLEFAGAGITHLKEAMDEKLLQAMMMGARLLQPRRQVESAEAAKTRMGAETSLLNSLTRVAELSVELIFEMWLKWSNRNAAETDYSYALNRDFVEESFDPNVVRVINESEMSGVISPLTAFNLRKRFEIYEDGTTFEAEQDLIETSSPITERLEPAPTRVDNQEDEAA
jgi:hypothetical protein